MSKHDVFCQAYGDYDDGAIFDVESGIKSGAAQRGLSADVVTLSLPGMDTGTATARLLAQRILRHGRNRPDVPTVNFLNIAPRANGTPEPFALMKLADGQLVVTTVGPHLRELKPHIESLHLLKKTDETAPIFVEDEQFRSRLVAEIVVPAVIDARVNKKGIDQVNTLNDLFEEADISQNLPAPTVGQGVDRIVEPDSYGNLKTGLTTERLKGLYGQKVRVTFRRNDGSEEVAVARVNKGLFSRLKPDRKSFSNVGPFLDDDQALTIYQGSDAYPLEPDADETRFVEFAAQHSDAGAYLNIDAAEIASIEPVEEKTPLTMIPRGKHRSFAKDNHFDYAEDGMPTPKGVFSIDDEKIGGHKPKPISTKLLSAIPDGHHPLA